MISEQENLPVQSSEREIEKLKLDLIKAKERVAVVEQKISFRPKGGNSKWTEELIKSRNVVQDIVNRINRLKRIEDDKLTAVILKKYEEDEKIRKEKVRVLALFEEFKENYKTDKPELKLTPKPDFNAVGVEWKKDRNYQARLKEAQKSFDSALYKSQNSPKMYSGKYAGALQRARNNLASALKSVEDEDGNAEFYTLRSKSRWFEIILAEREAYSLELQAYIDKTEKDLTLFKKHGLIPELKK